MVDTEGRMRRERIRRDSTINGSKNFPLWKIIILCVVVSILVQCSLSCILPFLYDLIKKTPKSTQKIIGITDSADKTKSLYLVEPFPVERWKGTANGVLVSKVRGEEPEVSKARVSEALAAISVAKSAWKNGNSRKCQTIMEHALALGPSHPDILAEYGAYLENLGEDMIKADGFYTKALSFNPHQEAALVGRERTRHIVAEMDHQEQKELRILRELFDSLPHTSIMRRAMRESYFAHIYHTVAIEGNTLNLGETRIVLETGMPIAGKSLIEHNEVLGMDAALRYLNRTLIDTEGITIDDILEIHRQVLGHVSPVDAGRLRSTQVYVGRFTPVAASEVLREMEEFVDWLNSKETSGMEPVERAAIAHYKLVLIHPFVDGNGRTSRLLMNLLLMRSGFPPVILPVEDKALYYATLHTANLGDLRPFVRFVAKHTRDTLQKYIRLGSTCNSIEC